MVWPSRRPATSPSLRNKRQMLGDGGIAQIQEFGQIADASFRLAQLAQDHQAVAVRHRLQHILRRTCGLTHLVRFYLHTCVYKKFLIDSQ